MALHSSSTPSYTNLNQYQQDGLLEEKILICGRTVECKYVRGKVGDMQLFSHIFLGSLGCFEQQTLELMVDIVQ